MVGETVDQEASVVVDEIKQYRDARWVTLPKALRRIYEFELSENYPLYVNCSAICLVST